MGSVRPSHFKISTVWVCVNGPFAVVRNYFFPLTFNHCHVELMVKVSIIIIHHHEATTKLPCGESEIVMAEHDTLGRARCPRGVNLIMVVMKFLVMRMRLMMMKRMLMRR